MQIPETPQSVEKLDLMIRLNEYANGNANWDATGNGLGANARAACRSLHDNLLRLIKESFAPLLTRTTAHEMETFTVHDPSHGRKVAHLMWHILDTDRRDRLTPPEIGMLVASAYLHDVGMALNADEREERLKDDSDLWHKLEIQESQKLTFDKLRKQANDPDMTEPQKTRARRMLNQAEEALLCQDTRERHAIRERYEKVLTQLQGYHTKDASKLPDVESCLSFAGDTFRDKLIDICVSHGKDTEHLVGNDDINPERPRFPSDYTLGQCTADLHMVASALRLADILDFDRERTPAVLFYYLLPPSHHTLDDRSVLEWSKHLSISNWYIDKDAIVFRGHCYSHIVHHAVVNFCRVIEDEIKSTLNTFVARKAELPFSIPTCVTAKIEEHGYTYVPYEFKLDDHRVYELLMGGAIYDESIVAVRELVQNAVDACKLHDALTRLDSPYLEPSTTERIFIRYEEPTDECPQPKLIVTDTGTGMDKGIIEKYFLKVGGSYYRSSHFNEMRLKLRTKNEELDFAPVSEFGIGFLSSFLLADRLKVETAMWKPIWGDTHKRTLIIDGPTRLIRLKEEKNDGLGQFSGTKVTLYLTRGSRSDKNSPPDWDEVRGYLAEVCQDLPYRLNLEHVSTNGQQTQDQIDPVPLKIELPPELEPLAMHIPVDDAESGLQGEIVFIDNLRLKELERIKALDSPISTADPRSSDRHSSVLLRGGFKVGDVPGLPRTYTAGEPDARLRFTWSSESDMRYPAPNVARSHAANPSAIANHVTRLWSRYLCERADDVPFGFLNSLHVRFNFHDHPWLEEFSAFTLFRLVSKAWYHYANVTETMASSWENSYGDPIPYYSYRRSFVPRVLDSILPRITSLKLREGGVFLVNPPQQDWRATMEEWHDYVASPVTWGDFIEFEDSIEHLLCYRDNFGTPSLNSRFQDQLLSIVEKDAIIQFMSLVNILGSTREAERQAVLDDYQMGLLKSVVEVLGDAEIGTAKDSWRLDSFVPSSS